MTLLRIGVVTQLRNEADVLPAFLAHIAAFADDAVLMDHGSLDASPALLHAACRTRPRWAAWRIAVPGHHQAAFTGFAARHLLRAGVDRVLFLDADEFVDLPSRAAIQDALARMDQPGDIGVWQWRDCVPDRMGVTLGFDDLIWQAPQPSRYPKVVLSQALFRASGGRAGPEMGAHMLRGAGIPTRDVPLGALLHLPLRSPEGMRRKVVLGSLAEMARTDRAPTDNGHWNQALARIAAAPLDADDVRGWAARYGEPGVPAARLDRAGLAARGFTHRTLSVAHVPPAAGQGAAAGATPDAPALPPAPTLQVPAVPAPAPREPKAHASPLPTPPLPTHPAQGAAPQPPPPWPDAWAMVAHAIHAWAPAPSAGLELELVDGTLRQAAAPASWLAPLTGAPLQDLARAVLRPGARVLLLGAAAGGLDVRASTDPADGPFDAVLAADMTAADIAAAHAALPPGGLLVGEGAAASAPADLVASLADSLAPGYGAPSGAPGDPSWRTALAGGFEVEQSVGLSGALLRPALAGMASRFDLADPQDATAARLVATLDSLLTRHGAVPPGRVAITARRLG